MRIACSLPKAVSVIRYSRFQFGQWELVYSHCPFSYSRCRQSHNTAGQQNLNGRDVNRLDRRRLARLLRGLRGCRWGDAE